MGELRVIKPGLYSSVQDMGRFGYRKFGVPVSGSMDQQSAHLANLLVGNPQTSPVIEMTLMGPELYFSKSTLIAITGAITSAFLDRKPIPQNQVILVAAGQTLFVERMISGTRSYLAISGLTSEKIMGSYSQYKGITLKKNLETNAVLRYEKKHMSPTNSHIKKPVPFWKTKTLEATPGPEFEALRDTIEGSFLKPLIVKQNDRMGYQLETKLPILNLPSMLTAPVVPGTVQLTPSGRLLVLMRDAQVSGGYPRIFQLTEYATNVLAQKREGDNIAFKLFH